MNVLILNRFLRYCYILCFPSRIYLICVLCAAYCVQAKTSNFSTEFTSVVPNPSRSEDDTMQTLKPIPHRDIYFQNSTGEIWNATTQVPSHRKLVNESAEFSAEKAYDADYADFEYYDLPLYIGPEVVVDLGPEEVVLSHNQGAPPPPAGRRKPVKDGFIWEQKMELLRLHNLYRSNVTPPAADMNFMEWDEYLSKAAQDWANGCNFIHAFPSYVEPGSMGQNLYMGWDPTGARAMYMWNEEYLYYDLKTLGCQPGQQCGHYTQMSWSESHLVGCGMKRCGVKRFFVVCHYQPTGNIVGTPPYIVGKTCSQCRSEDGGLCTNNLCVTKEQCNRNKDKCNYECPLECHNCGVLDKDTCRCTCADGWDSLDCSRPCKNAHDRCGKNPGWPTVTSCPTNRHAVANVYCRKMCGKCYGVKNVNIGNVCCNGTVCDDGYTLNTKSNKCKCGLLCPGPECYIVPDDYAAELSESSSEASGSQYHSKDIYTMIVLVIIYISFVTPIYGRLN